jgi:hypothetical protein
VIDDQILRALRKKAAEEDRTVQEVTNELLRQALAERHRPPFKLKLTGWRAAEQPGVDILDRDKLFDLMNGR